MATSLNHELCSALASGYPRLLNRWRASSCRRSCVRAFAAGQSGGRGSGIRRLGIRQDDNPESIHRLSTIRVNMVKGGEFGIHGILVPARYLNPFVTAPRQVAYRPAAKSSALEHKYNPLLFES